MEVSKNSRIFAAVFRQVVRTVLRLQRLSRQGWFPEWPNGADCKSAASSFGGSNPSPPTFNQEIASIEQSLFCSPTLPNHHPYHFITPMYLTQRCQRRKFTQVKNLAITAADTIVRGRYCSHQRSNAPRLCFHEQPSSHLIL